MNITSVLSVGHLCENTEVCVICVSRDKDQSNNVHVIIMLEICKARTLVLH